MLIGYAITGSFCTLKKSLEVMQTLKDEGHEILPIFSYNVRDTSTRFFQAQEFRTAVENICDNEVIDTIVGAEPLGPVTKCDVMCVSPCTSNTLAKLRYGITDTPVTMAVKAHVRNDRPVVIALCTNDGLGAAAANLGAMMIRRNYYFAPLFQDDLEKKPRSLITDMTKVSEVISLAMDGIQYQPMILCNH